VANYPYDGTSDRRTKNSPCDDDDVFRRISSAYASLNPDMMTNLGFVNGITNGAAWYPLYGGMQDVQFVPLFFFTC